IEIARGHVRALRQEVFRVPSGSACGVEHLDTGKRRQQREYRGPFVVHVPRFPIVDGGVLPHQLVVVVAIACMHGQLPFRASQIPASTTAPPMNCAAPMASPKRIHANIAAITGWISRLTDESDAGKCAKAYAMRP